MTLFVDTNIFLDILYKRGDYKEALLLFKAVKNKLFTGVVADITIVNIDYISKKVSVDTLDFLQAIENYYHIVGANNSVIQEALQLNNKDIEDNIQYILAKENGCECIVTNDKGFYRGDLPLFTGRMFVEKYLP